MFKLRWALVSEPDLQYSVKGPDYSHLEIIILEVGAV